MLHVYDTFVTTGSGKIMHFDVIIDSNDDQYALQSAQHWLTSIGESVDQIKSTNCVFCHSIEESKELKKAITTSGYVIYKLEGCPA